MTRYLALYIGSANNRSSAPPDAETEEKGMAEWAEWAIAHDASIINQGAPLGKTKRVSSTGISEKTNLITGYVLVEAASHADAAKLFEKHPHFRVFSGENSIEVIECLDMPGQ